MSQVVDAVILSASGYAGAEVARLLSAHPHLRLTAVTGHSTAGQRLSALHPHLADQLPHMPIHWVDDLGGIFAAGTGPVAIFGCGAHGGSAVDTATAMNLATDAGRQPRVVDLSADFRHDAATFERLYGSAHPQPALLERFHCGLPDLEPELKPEHACQPGCFTTSVTLACAPLIAAGVAGSEIRVSSVTGSTGSGRTPSAGTHHPRRNSNLWGYKPLAHRHAPEMEMLIGRAAGSPVKVRFAPHSGPFARGIASTCFLQSTSGASAAELRRVLEAAYAHTDLVQIDPGPPELASVVGTNDCRLAVSTDGEEIVVHSVIDNLLKGAAGGAVQWMNRLCGWPDATGLRRRPIPWS